MNHQIVQYLRINRQQVLINIWLISSILNIYHQYVPFPIFKIEKLVILNNKIFHLQNISAKVIIPIFIKDMNIIFFSYKHKNVKDAIIFHVFKLSSYVFRKDNLLQLSST